MEAPIFILQWRLRLFVNLLKMDYEWYRRQIPLKFYRNGKLKFFHSSQKAYGNKEIAEKLYISVKTVEAHKSKIMEKLQLKSRPELVEYALRKKFLNF